MLKIIREKFIISILMGIFVAAASFVILVVCSPQYKATARVLVVQDQLGTQDYYSLTKSAEYLSNILMEAVYSTTFLDVVKNEHKINDNFFPKNRKKELKKWEKVVRMNKNVGAGILEINVFGNNQEEVYQIADVVIGVLRHKNYLFRGKTNVDIRLLSDVIIDRNPSFKMIVLAILGGFVLGFSLSNVMFYYKRMYRDARLISGTTLFL
jgi:capsular polysaccharide biosynthesis protein